MTEVGLRDTTSALTAAAVGDRTRLLPILGSSCIVSFPTDDPSAVGVMRVFSIATAAQGTTLVSGVVRTGVDAPAVIERGQAAVDTTEVARCLSEALASAMATQLPGGRIDILDHGGAEGLPPGVGSAQFVARVSGGDSVFTVSMVSIAITVGPLVSVTAEVALVPRDEGPFLPGDRSTSSQQAGRASARPSDSSSEGETAALLRWPPRVCGYFCHGAV